MSTCIFGERGGLRFTTRLELFFTFARSFDHGIAVGDVSGGATEIAPGQAPHKLALG